jgi:hypothetical protein
MRAYKFLDAKFGLKSLYERRLKQSRVSDLNDPFELTPYDLTDIAVRKAFYKTREEMDSEKGLVCFSKDWNNPVIWAHYSDKHQGLCLGFEIPEMKGDPENDEADQVTYIPELMQFPPNFEKMSDPEHTAFVRNAIFRKFEDWGYEKEIRVWGPLTNEESGFYFVPFGENMLLTEVIIGQKCPLSKAAIMRALGSLAGEVKISKARAAYDKFEMVEDEQGS